MGFGKSFLLSLVAFVGLNFVFSLLYYVITAGFDSFLTTITDAPLMILYFLFGSAASIPSTNLNWAIVEPLLNSNMDFLILGIGFLITPIIASILAGKFAESKGQGIGAWLLTTVISTAAIVIGVIPGFSSTFVSTILTFYGWSGFELTLIFLVISCVVNIVYGGFFALLVVETEYY
ncbi:MAG: hypothetical protein ACXABO_02765 [Promethearchaeota archaeon]|jgi:hypothetical protein